MSLNEVLIRPEELKVMLGISLTTIWRYRRMGTFPAPISLGPRLIAWRLETINEWIEQQGVQAK